MLSCSVRVHFLSIEYIHVQGITYVKLLMSSLIRVSASLLGRRETAIETYLLTKAWPPVTRRIYVASKFLGKHVKL